MYEKLKDNYLVSIEGKNVYEFLKRIIKEDIEIKKISYQDIHHLFLLLSKEDYKTLTKIKTSYKIKIKKAYGRALIKQFLKKHAFYLFSLCIAFSFLFFLTHIITEVEVIHTDKKLREALTEVLEKEQIKKGSFTKSYGQIQEIKKKIMEKYKENIEWVEIEQVGTKYIVRLEERILPIKEVEKVPSHIVSNSYAIIKEVEATKGVIMKQKESYVKPGDILISGDIYLNEELKDQVASEGTVYGEVWYTTTVEYPYFYEEVKETGKTKRVYTFTFLNKRIELTRNPFKEKKISAKTILKNNVFPISFQYETQKEVVTIKQDLTKEEAINKALEEIKKKIEESLKEKEYIISIKKLKVEENNSKIIVEAFVSVYKNIGVRQNAEIISREEKNSEE